MKKQVNWHKIYRYVDHHNITSLLYYAILGTENELAEKQEEELYQKYRKELLLAEAYRQAEETIIWQLEQHNIHAISLLGTEEYDLYYKKEMGSINCLEFLIDPKEMKNVQSLMEAMDYERKEDNGCIGLIYVRTPGIRVRFLKEIPVSGRPIQKILKKQMKTMPYVQKLSVEKKYIYHVIDLMEQYLMGNITIRKILDFWLYRNKFLEKVSKEEVTELLNKLGMRAWEQCLDALGRLWFGDGISVEEGELVFALEEYILNPGRVDLRLDNKLLPTRRERLDFYDRDREAEWKDKRWKWVFPSIEYMKEIFPILRKIPVLIVFCWGIRGSRILKKITKQKVITIQQAMLYKMKKIKTKEKKDEKNEHW